MTVRGFWSCWRRWCRRRGRGGKGKGNRQKCKGDELGEWFEDAGCQVAESSKARDFECRALEGAKTKIAAGVI